MNDVKKPYCHECAGRHFKDEPCRSMGMPAPKPEPKLNYEGKGQMIADRTLAEMACPVCERRRMKQRELMRKRRAKS